MFAHRLWLIIGCIDLCYLAGEWRVGTVRICIIDKAGKGDFTIKVRNRDMIQLPSSRVDESFDMCMGLVQLCDTGALVLCMAWFRCVLCRLFSIRVEYWGALQWWEPQGQNYCHDGREPGTQFIQLAHGNHMHSVDIILLGRMLLCVRGMV